MSRQFNFSSSLSTTGGDTCFLSRAKSAIASNWMIVLAVIVFSIIAIYYYFEVANLSYFFNLQIIIYIYL